MVTERRNFKKTENGRIGKSMSAKLMGKVFELKLSRPEKYVLLAMADFASDDGTNVFPSVARLAWKLDLSERQVQRIIKRLKIAGILKVVKYAKGGTNNPVHYKIDLSQAEMKESFKTQKIVEPYDEWCEENSF